MERLSIDEVIAQHKEKAEFFKRTTNVAYGLKLEQIANWLEELKSYKDAEEQGLMLGLPVAIGSIVYRINEYADEPLIPMGVTSIEIKGITDTFKEMKCKECVFGGEFTYRFTDIGKTVFLTKEEAEQALKQMGE